MSEQHMPAPIELHEAPVSIGRYLLHRQIARGGMASIHIGRLVGDQGFDRIVAVKRLHPEFAEDVEFVAMFLNEARVASKVKHRNVVPVLDVVTAGDEVMLVQEYVHGAPLHWILKATQQAGVPMPLEIAVAIACQVLSGLHAAHETVDEMGMPLEIVHRDVSPQNVLVATDGSARLLDFGVAKASVAAHITRSGTYKGKLAYSAPEQIRGAATRQSDVYSMSVVLWEMIVGHRMHRAGAAGTELIEAVLRGALPTIREAMRARATEPGDEARAPEIEALEQVVSRGLALDMSQRWATAADMEEALRSVITPASASVLSAWLRVAAREFIERRERLIAAEESSWRKQKSGFDARTASSVPPQDSSIRMRVWPDSTLETTIDAIEEGSRAQSARTPKVRAYRGLLALVIVVLAIGIGVVLGTRHGLESAPTQVVPPDPVVVQTPAVTQPPAPTPPPAPEAAKPAREADEDEASSHRRSESRESSSRSRSDSRARTRQPSPPPTSAPSAPPPAPPSTASGRAADDCATPYYFEGQKKIFKPACL